MHDARTKFTQGLGIAAALLGLLLSIQGAYAQGRIYETAGDFQSGIIISLNDDGDRLLLADEGTPLPFVYVPTTGGSILRLDAATGDVLGEYSSAPDTMNQEPFRCAVDLLGNLWAANWYEKTDDCGGVTVGATLVRVGVVVGGTRTDATGAPDPNGEYLKPPFLYNTCIDRDGDGLIRTSRGLGDRLPWSNAGQADTCGGVSTCEDEAILNFVRVELEEIPEMLAVDGNNDLWVGGSLIDFTGRFDTVLQKVSGVLGIPIPGQRFEADCGGADAIVSGTGELISTSGDNFGALAFGGSDEDPMCIDRARSRTVAIDPTTGYTWQANPDDFGLEGFDETGHSIGSIELNGQPRDFTIDANGDFWVSSSQKGFPNFQRWIPDPNNPGEYLLHWQFEYRSTVLSIDDVGKIWIGNEFIEEIIRIDPNAGPTPIAGLPPRGEIDLTIPLPTSVNVAGYGDGTGFTVLANTVDEGRWNAVHDSEQEGTPWGTLIWNGIEPKGTFLEVKVRASDNEAALASEEFRIVENGVSFNDVAGRYAEIQVRFVRTPDARGESPILESIQIEPAECHLLVAEGPGDDTYRFGGNSHTFSTRLETIYRAYPVLMESIPSITLHLPRPEELTKGNTPLGANSGEKPARTFFVQVVMHNPRIFPGTPEQSTPGMKVNVWRDGRVTTTKYGDPDGNMDLEIEVLGIEDGIIELRVPFTVGAP